MLLFRAFLFGRSLFQSDGFEGTGLDAFAARDTAFRQAAFHVDYLQHINGANEGADPAAGAFQRVNLYGHI
jgi:hypothetical protein